MNLLENVQFYILTRSLDNLYAMYIFMNLGVFTGLDYYLCTDIKLKSALNISYDATLSANIINIM